MLPKVANQILHASSRAVAAAQYQSHMLRNVLQLQTSSGQSSSGSIWNGVGSSSSSWGSNGSGTGPGGHKFNSSSRYYSSYAGAGRAVTQANVSSSSDLDGSFVESDETEEAQTRPSARSRRTGSGLRGRSQSISFGARDHSERSELGVLKAVQLHARAKHTLLGSHVEEENDSTLQSAHTRHNSTAAAFADLDLSSLSADEELTTVVSKDSPAPRSNSRISTLPETATLRDINCARQSGDYASVLDAVGRLRLSPESVTIHELNAALEAIATTKPYLETLSPLVQLYNDFVTGGQSQILPNGQTYSIMLLALASQDHKARGVIASHESAIRRAQLLRSKNEFVLELEASIKQLMEESQSVHSIAIALFEAASARNVMIPAEVYTSMLRSCALRGDIDRAITIFAQLESQKTIRPTAIVFAHLITAYINARDLAGARLVFKEFREASQQRRLIWSSDIASAGLAREFVWHKMIDAHFACGDAPGALDLLEQMMDSPEMKYNSNKFVPGNPPPPSQLTFTRIITGFCTAGDYSSALVWYKRLLDESTTSSTTSTSSRDATLLERTAWTYLSNGLLEEGRVPEFLDLYKAIVLRAPSFLNSDDRYLLALHVAWYVRDNKDSLDRAEAISMLNVTADFSLVTRVHHKDRDAIYLVTIMNIADFLRKAYLALGDVEGSVALVEKALLVARVQMAQGAVDEESLAAQEAASGAVALVSKTITGFSTRQLQPLTFALGVRLLRLAAAVALQPEASTASLFYHNIYQQANTQDLSTLTKQEWHSLILCANLVDLPALAHVLENLSQSQAAASFFQDAEIVASVAESIRSSHNIDELASVLSQLPPDQEAALKRREEDTDSVVSSLPSDTLVASSEPSSPLVSPSIQFDIATSRAIDDAWKSGNFDALATYRQIEDMLASGRHPTHVAISRTINALGRYGAIDKMRRLYEVAQVILAAAPRKLRFKSWLMVECQMVIGYAHAGNMDAALMHRARILEQGLVPTPDAYGSLIQNVKDTTDDASNALGLFQEGLAHGLQPNTYLYNTIISKLSKARKADQALELFEQMKAQGVLASSITYGAVIAACCRVGDAQSAETLFAEMTAQTNFKPRVPPYNTMMQLYAHIKPDRERVLFYFDSMVRSGVSPTVHSYKLLLDAYGTIEPVDIDGMNKVLKDIEANVGHIQGVHWASVINAHGCVKKDLDRAIETFENLRSTSRNNPLPDAITFEALFNVLVTHRRADLFSRYLERLEGSGIHMTAYIANLVIKGYALSGQLDKARAFFEGLSDPPEGVAAPGNHAPHAGEVLEQVPVSAPVYREPSTWEHMVRAELGAGEREKAVALLERLQARKFPVAVYNRISGIMLDDDTVSPWPATPLPGVTVA